ncbi:hypothetical protein KI688_004101 [Linnemannia hyalina]|uniref:Metallo-beta-lactamase domain-containing protein n=1 Tax=Linnemannia hyalina TaxID=64524 RepID=A0A9P8BSJ7_9FUNG|nr:hypothetical protein KI688_004101 [Linnemannia hyalina]
MATKETPKLLPDQNEFLELRPGLFRCTFVLTFGPVGLPIATFLIRGNPIPATDDKAHEWIMIDAGAPPHAAQILTAVERVLSHPQDTLKYLCITHAHMDHTGATLLLLERYPTCTVIAHPDERPFLCDGKGYNSCSGDRWVFNAMKFLTGAPAKMRVPVEKVVWVKEGEGWEYGWLVKVFETPGHTPGTCYMDTAIQSMDKIISLKDQVDTVFPAHNYNADGVTVQEMEALRATPSP